MSMTDPIADMLSRIRNGQMAQLASVFSPGSSMRLGVLRVLKEEGYIADFKEEGDKAAGVTITLKYFEAGPVIQKLQKVSTPGCRVYKSVKDLPRVANGLGIAIISTSKGIMSDFKARQANVGGEVLCTVF